MFVLKCLTSSKVWRAPGSKMATLAEKLAPDTKPAPPTSPAATLVIMFPYRLGFLKKSRVVFRIFGLF